jgi:putative glutamine amidotransferase
LTTIAVVASDRNGSSPDPCLQAVATAGGHVRIITPDTPAPGALAGVGGLLIPDSSGASSDLELLSAALALDMPVLSTGSGMHLLNTCFGGDAPVPLEGHDVNSDSDFQRHQIYLSPGSKVAAIIGSAGMFRVNSRHRLGLRERHRSPRLMSIAYHLDDGVIEGLESKEHSWVIGVQFLPERADEVPANFNNLFLGLVERAGSFAGRAPATG